MKATSVLAIGGLDPSGGAGLGMDRVTAAARGVWCRLVASALTAQDGHHFQGAWPAPLAALEAQLEAALADGAIQALKIGMLPNGEAVELVARVVAETGLPSVLDPVFRTSSGGDLIGVEGRAALLEQLLPSVSLVTPNLPEAAVLTARSEEDVRADPAAAARALLDAGARAVLLKGGHGEGPESVDWLVRGETALELRTARVATPNARGTGCSLATAIAAELALGAELEPAVRAAKLWFDTTLEDGSRLDFGTSPGPLPVLGAALRERQDDGGQGRSLRS